MLGSWRWSVGKDPSAMMAGLLMRRFHNAYLDELKAVREALGEDWVKIRRNRNGRSERYFPVLDGLYKLTREMDECGEALMGGGDPHPDPLPERERGRLSKAGPEESTREGWPGECSWPGMQEVFGEAFGEAEYSLADEAQVNNTVPRLGRIQRFIGWLMGGR